MVIQNRKGEEIVNNIIAQSKEFSEYIQKQIKTMSHLEVVGFYEVMRITSENNIAHIKGQVDSDNLNTIIMLQNLLRKSAESQKFSFKDLQNEK